MTDILVVDDQRSTFVTVARLIRDVEDVRVVGRVSTADQVIPTVLELQPDVVLMNLIMLKSRGDQTPGMWGLEVTQEIADGMPGVHVLIYTALTRPDLIVLAKMTGAAGYLPKDCPPDQLLDSI